MRKRRLFYLTFGKIVMKSECTGLTFARVLTTSKQIFELSAKQVFVNFARIISTALDINIDFTVHFKKKI